MVFLSSLFCDLLLSLVHISQHLPIQRNALLVLANLNGGVYQIQEDMIDPGNFTKINVDDIDAMKPSKVSMMPGGLLDTLTRDEILDLIAYMKSTVPGQPAGSSTK